MDPKNQQAAAAAPSADSSAPMPAQVEAGMTPPRIKVQPLSHINIRSPG